MAKTIQVFPSSVTDNVSVVGLITAAAGTVGTYKHRKEDGMPETNQVHIHLSGTWTATVKLQSSIPDRNSWADVPSGSFTANTSEAITLGGSVDLRWYCSSYTSGTIEAAFLNR